MTTTDTGANICDLRMIVGGEHVDALDGQATEVLNLATGQVIGREVGMHALDLSSDVKNVFVDLG